MRTKSAGELSAQIEGVNTVRKERGESDLYLEPGDKMLSEQELRAKYGNEAFEQYVNNLRSVYKKERSTHVSVYAKSYGSKTENIPTWLRAGLERRIFVEGATKNMETGVRALDIGCGTGLNTSWIGDVEGNEWIGIDSVDAEKLGVKLPKHGKFLQGNFSDETFRSEGELVQTFNMIIDQGAVLTSLQNSKELGDYLSAISAKLETGGKFLALTSCNHEGNNSYPDNLPDGRRRMFFSSQAFKEEPFSKYFEVIREEVIVYPPEDERNPYSKVPGNTRSIGIIQVEFLKK